MHTNQAGANAHALTSGKMLCFHLAGAVKLCSSLSQMYGSYTTARARYTYMRMGTLPPAAMCHLMHNSENLFTWRSRLHPPRKTSRAGDGLRPDSYLCACNIRRVGQQGNREPANTATAPLLGVGQVPEHLHQALPATTADFSWRHILAV